MTSWHDPYGMYFTWLWWWYQNICSGELKIANDISICKIKCRKIFRKLFLSLKLKQSYIFVHEIKCTHGMTPLIKETFEINVSIIFLGKYNFIYNLVKYSRSYYNSNIRVLNKVSIISKLLYSKLKTDKKWKSTCCFKEKSKHAINFNFDLRS